jgi:hypothetical protein
MVEAVIGLSLPGLTCIVAALRLSMAEPALIKEGPGDLKVCFAV